LLISLASGMSFVLWYNWLSDVWCVLHSICSDYHQSDRVGSNKDAVDATDVSPARRCSSIQHRQPWHAGPWCASRAFLASWCSFFRSVHTTFRTMLMVLSFYLWQLGGRCIAENVMGNSAATHVATVILTRDISGTAYILKHCTGSRVQWRHAMLQVARCKVVTRWVKALT